MATPRFLSASAARTTAFSSAFFSRKRFVWWAKGANSSQSAMGICWPLISSRRLVSARELVRRDLLQELDGVNGPSSILSLLTT